jgi:hypothetical protein
MTSDSGEESWPETLDEDALHGAIGDLIRLIGPETEADPAALLIQSIVGLGSLIGRGPHQWVGADRHGLNLYTVVVGKSSKARKGTSWSHVRRLLEAIDPSLKFQSGLSSGEGLIHALRDREGEDPGAADKRMLITESEFAALLRMASRSGNTSSAIIRQAWDGHPMQVMTKNSPEKASNTHLAIVAHITEDELRKELTGSDSANGFANRFLWVCARRARLLPDGGSVPEQEFLMLQERIKGTVLRAQERGEFLLRRNPEASKYWHSIYPELSDESLGGYGPIVSRAEAQVMRISSVYAVLDDSVEIRDEHLRAAVAVWRYCKESARYIFGGDALSSDEQAIFDAVNDRPDGLSRTQISHLFSRNRPANQIRAAIASLEGGGLITPTRVQTGGRPTEVWIAVPNSAPPDDES